MVLGGRLKSTKYWDWTGKRLCLSLSSNNCGAFMAGSGLLIGLMVTLLAFFDYTEQDCFLLF